MPKQVIDAQPGQTTQIVETVPAASAGPGTAIETSQSVTELTAPSPAVEIANRFFGTLDGALMTVLIALALALLARVIQALMIHLTLRKAIVSNSPLAGDLVEKINRPFERAGPTELPGDDRNGLVLIAIGLAMACGGWVIGDAVTLRLAVAASFFPLFVGIALLVRRQLVLRAIKREESAA